MVILITGGAGYIGTHTCVELLNAGHDLIVVDNLTNSSFAAVERVQEITGRKIKFYNNDISDRNNLENIFFENHIETVIHLAGYKAVGESVSYPLRYYQNNIISTMVLCDVMNQFNVKNMVFSSSATVYAPTETGVVNEQAPLCPSSPYGRTKMMLEQILQDICHSDHAWKVVVLRYFNPVGAHCSGLIGESCKGVPNNIMPYITQVAVGNLNELKVFGDNYKTTDGTGIRDYIHVTDLAAGHLAAVVKLSSMTGLATYNLGTGKGYSVYELIKSFEKAAKVCIPYRVVERRAGDVAICYADPHKAQQELNWAALRGIDDICQDAWRWQRNNPTGYGNG